MAAEKTQWQTLPLAKADSHAAPLAYRERLAPVARRACSAGSRWRRMAELFASVLRALGWTATVA
jgi:hypothetical protein